MNEREEYVKLKPEVRIVSLKDQSTISETGSSQRLLPEVFSSLFWQTAEPADTTSLPQVISICLWQAPAVTP